MYQKRTYKKCKQPQEDFYYYMMRVISIIVEYMYQMLKHNNCKLPQEGLYMVRYHSFYSWHTGGDYRDLVDNVDMKMMDWVLEFKWV